MSADGAGFSSAQRGACQAFKQEARGPLVVDVAQGRLDAMRAKVTATAQLIDRDKRLERLAYRCWFVTLTYERVGECKPQDVNRFRRALAERFKRKGWTFRYVWVAELQERGALHYHLMIWWPRRARPPKFDQVGLWPHGMTQRERARAPVAYITKYASKLHSKCGDHAFPKGFRMHGFGGLPPAAASFRRWKFLPQWARDLGDESLELRPAPGGGRFSRATGEWWPSPWVITGIHRVPGFGVFVVIQARGLQVEQPASN